MVLLVDIHCTCFHRRQSIIDWLEPTAMEGFLPYRLVHPDDTEVSFYADDAYHSTRVVEGRPPPKADPTSEVGSVVKQPGFVKHELPEIPKIEAELPVPYAVDSSTLTEPQRQPIAVHHDLTVSVTVDEEGTGTHRTVDVVFAENGEIQLMDDQNTAAAHPELDESMKRALRNAYMTGLYNGMRMATNGEMCPTWSFYWSPNFIPHSPLPAMGHPFRSKRKAVSPTFSKKGRRAKMENRTCRNCGTKTTPFWRKDRFSGAPLCNACGLYFTKNDDHRPATLWQSQTS